MTKGQQVVQRVEAAERRVGDPETAPQPLDDRLTDQRNGAEQVGDDRRRPEAHLAPGQHVAHEGRGHHGEQDRQPDPPQHLARRLVGAVVEAAEDVKIDHDEEERRPVGVHVAEEPAVVHVAHDALDAVEGHVHVRRVVHGEHDAGGDLDYEGETRQRAEIPCVVQIARRRIDDEVLVDVAEDRQAAVEPAHEAVVRKTVHGSRLRLSRSRRCRRR